MAEPEATDPFDAAVAGPPDALALSERWSELRHEAHAALFGIEAAATGITRHRDLMTSEQLAQLSDALVAEVHHLHVLLDRGPVAATTEVGAIDLLEVIEPVVECLRAAGVEVRLDVPRRLTIDGIATHTAQVVRALLTNAHDHAPGAAVEVRATIESDHVLVSIDDTGPGMPAELRRAAFGRGTRRQGSCGSGLGLFIARQLMDEQDGSIWIEPRPSGGTSVRLRFGRPAHPPGLHVVA